MKINYIPQRNDDILVYEFLGESITANLNGKQDVFDFSSLEDGYAEEITSELPIMPIISASKIEGVLNVELLYYHSSNATELERFPIEMEV